MDEVNGVYIIQRSESDPQRKLIRYDPANGLTRSTNIPYTDDVFGDSTSLYLDRENRIWVSDRAWFSVHQAGVGIPHIVIRSPVFIDYLDELGYYSWVRPKIMLQSIDGRLWYQSSRGDAWYDHATGEWCLFTPHKSNIVEDSQHNLWMLIGNDLYVLPLSP